MLCYQPIGAEGKTRLESNIKRGELRFIHDWGFRSAAAVSGGV